MQNAEGQQQKFGQDKFIRLFTLSFSSRPCVRSDQNILLPAFERNVLLSFDLGWKLSLSSANSNNCPVWHQLRFTFNFLFYSVPNERFLTAVYSERDPGANNKKKYTKNAQINNCFTIATNAIGYVFAALCFVFVQCVRILTLNTVVTLPGPLNSTLQFCLLSFSISFYSGAICFDSVNLFT